MVAFDQFTTNSGTFRPVTTPVPRDPGAEPALPSLRILVIDDEEPIRTTLRMMLEHAGHRVDDAPDGVRGLELAAEGPDLILCDVNMPEANGYEVLETVRRSPQLRDVPFIFLTGMDDRRSVRQGMTLGADDYVTKPFTVDEVNGAIRACYWKHAELRLRLRQLAEARRSEENAPWAHELLTPIHGVLGFATMLEEEAETISREELRWMASGIRKSGERQLAIAKKILRHYELGTRRETGRSGDPVATTSRVLAEAAAAASSAAERQGDVAVDCAEAQLDVHAPYLETIGLELVENACKFSKPGLPVAVRGAVVDGRYRLEVVDTGLGMSAEERASIAPFRQFGRERHEQQGMGLGLSLVRDIAELHGGRLVLSPGTAGVGLRVTVELPLAAES